ncbi:MAG: EamA family transporter [Erysipelotrichales bacterium]|nr:EamA family transporter [Erysipelotrichales bacterium]MBQ1385185.1 EamA family transporter [Erysipelotrichales bacterium]MBQ2479567.1 EamA family transporter [Erysipelotrichales bacterium]MBQ4375518.1 EamA family transporter [Erysipelotrichales bacterium]MBQ5542191.1 EamA family transporter [Erysipelotrichales bacterium]
MNRLAAAILFELTIAVSALLQVPLKKAAQNPKYKGIHYYLNPIVIAVYGSFFAITIITTFLFKYVDLTLSTILYKTEYIFITVFSVLFLKEKITKRKLLGFIVILCGVLSYALL